MLTSASCGHVHFLAGPERPKESERERERNTEKDKQLQAAMWEMRETDRVAETEREREISSGPVPSELRAQHP